MTNTANAPRRFLLRQNNTGGYYTQPTWTGPSALGGVICNTYARHPVDVWVVAHDSTEACMLASRYAGVYFDGVGKGIDCDCCGDRWYGAEDF